MNSMGDNECLRSAGKARAGAISHGRPIVAAAAGAEPPIPSIPGKYQSSLQPKRYTVYCNLCHYAPPRLDSTCMCPCCVVAAAACACDL